MRFVMQLAAVAAVVGLSSVAGAATTYNSPLSGPFNVGNGIPNAGFKISNDGRTELALGGVLRFEAGLTDPDQDGVYLVPAGATTSTNAPAAQAGTPAWGFNWSFTEATPGTIRFIEWVVDFDPTGGVQNVTVSGAVPTGGIPAQDSWHLGFNFWDAAAGQPVYDMNALGDYVVTLNAYSDSAGGQLINSVSATYRVQAVPVPAAAVAGFALLGGIGAFRRVRRQA